MGWKLLLFDNIFDQKHELYSGFLPHFLLTAFGTTRFIISIFFSNRFLEKHQIFFNNTIDEQHENIYKLSGFRLPVRALFDEDISKWPELDEWRGDWNTYALFWLYFRNSKFKVGSAYRFTWTDTWAHGT